MEAKTKNNKRVEAIDFVRGVSVLLMIPVHVMIVYSTMDTWNTSMLGKIIQVAEKGTPMFLVVMGLSFVFSGNLSMKKILIRGIRILMLGYLLNLMRFIVPMVVFGGFPDDFITANGLTPGDPKNYVFYTLLGDILQLAGISLIIMGIIIKVIKNKYAALILALIIMLTSRAVSGFRFDIVGIDYICDLLWAKTYNVYFPVFPWMSFILIGLFFGMWYKEQNYDLRFMFGKMLPYGLGMLLFGGGLCYINYEYHFGDYYHLGPGGTIILMGINLLLIWFGNIIVKHINPKVFSVIKYASKNVTSFYFIQWVIIYWGILFFGYSQQSNQLKILAIIVVFTLITFTVLWFKNKIQEAIKQKRVEERNEKQIAIK
ncbi:heparan-alpha-glucosaminide N-acetyltransferase domain-containing protein [Tenacibaculum halocynthiae]|uniref:heparan-alpha-glucosaminide N-acetyltransferase domain-containing protein n=1 Tax=Tenacibaculum halocynthiae TaxID=1254437 RepID=UPI003D65BFDC